LNFHDIFTLRGIGFHPLKYPLILGNEAVGTLEDGTEVVLYPLMSDPSFKGSDITLDPKRHVIGELTQGTLAEYVVIPKENVVPKPKGLSNEAAATLGIAWLTAYRMLFKHSGLTSGQKMLVQGSSGGVATALVQLGVAAGLTVWTTGRTKEKRIAAAKAGAHRTFEALSKLPERVDAVFDLSGEHTLPHSVASVRVGGKVVIAGIHSGATVNLELFRVLTDQVTIVGSYLGTKQDFKAMLDFVVDKEIEPTVALVLPLSRVEEGLRVMHGGLTPSKIVAKIHI
jgi:NADPH:quinone reductase-like Zn-dependent oxidoreductase